jgi:hypothetical protein
MTTTARERLATGALGVSFGLLFLVGLAGPSAARPGLGSRGWAPGDLLPWAPGAALVTALLWAAYLTGAGGVALRASRPVAVRALRWRWPLLLAAGALLSSPFGSADHTNYAAYGRIAAQGGDPYLTPPIAWHGGHDPVTGLVEPPWTTTVSVYGPFATAVQALTSLLGGDSMRQTVWLWQVVIVLAWLGVRALLLHAGASGGRVDLLWTLNPLVFGIGVLGAHVDLLAAALALAAVVVLRRDTVLVAAASGVLAGLAVSTKVTYGLVVVAVPVAWWLHRRSGFAGRTTTFALGALVVVVPLHLWAGPHVFEQLNRARRSISLATPWRLVLQLLEGPLGQSAARTVVTWLALAVFVLLTVVLVRLSSGLAPTSVVGSAARGLFVLTTAYTLAAPYSLPWYALLTWATLPVLAASLLDQALLAHLLALAVAYVPGRVVGLTAGVERVTLWVRRSLAPYAVLLVWVWLTLAAVRAWRRSASPRPRVPAR